MAKEKDKLNPYLLFSIGAILLVAAWLMRSFPILIFAALAPLMAIADHADEENSWNKMELVGVALALGFWAGHVFATSSVIYAMIQSILFALVFVLYAYVRFNLGSRLGKLPLVFFWLALEYVVLKSGQTSNATFLADSLAVKMDWIRWTGYTGYLGVSAWILLANLFLYQALLNRGLQLPYLVVFCLVVAAPIIYSYTLEDSGTIGRESMIQFYRGAVDTSLPASYVEKAEWTARTAAWISVLIALFALVKSNTRKNDRSKKS